MLINEFDLDIDEKLSNAKPKEISFCWFQMRDNYDYFVDDVVNKGRTRMIILMKRHQKGIYKIMPNFEIVIK